MSSTSKSRSLRIARVLHLVSQIQPALHVLSQAGIKVVLLKGGAYLHLLFEVGERAMGDVDILVSPEDYDRAGKVLTEAGYELSINYAAKRPFTHWVYHECSYFLPSSATIDLHRQLDEPRRWHMDENLMDRAVPATGWGEGIFRLSNEDMILHAAIHAAKEQFASKLGLGRDIFRIVSVLDIEWEIFVERAHQWGAASVSWLALEHSRLRYGAKIPTWVLRALRPDGLRRLYLDRFYRPEEELMFSSPESDKKRLLLARYLLPDHIREGLIDLSFTIFRRSIDMIISPLGITNMIKIHRPDSTDSFGDD